MYVHSNPSQAPAYNGCCFTAMGVFQVILGLSSMSFGSLLVFYGWRGILGYGIWSGFMLVVVGSVACGAGGKRTPGCAGGTLGCAITSFIFCSAHFGFAVMDYLAISGGYYTTGLLHFTYISLITTGFFGLIFNIVLIVRGAMGACGKPMAVGPTGHMIVSVPMQTHSYGYGQGMMNSPEMQQGPPMQQNYPGMQQGHPMQQNYPGMQQGPPMQQNYPEMQQGPSMQQNYPHDGK